MKCNACKQNIELHLFDIGDAFEEVSPLSFRKGTYHRFCFELLIEEAKDTESKHIEYKSRYDEYLTKYC
jgi:hypothetical protein